MILIYNAVDAVDNYRCSFLIHKLFGFKHKTAICLLTDGSFILGNYDLLA